MAVSTYRPQGLAQLGLVVDLPIGDDFFVEWGHFEGKEGLHINGRLDKQFAFRDERSLRWLIEPMQSMVSMHKPDLLVGPQTSGARVAKKLGGMIGVSAYPLSDDAEVDPELADINFVLVDDNYITGKRLSSALCQLAQVGAVPKAAVMMFNSSGLDLADLGPVPMEAAHDLSIDAQPAASCDVCRLLGSHTLGMSAIEIGDIDADSAWELQWR